MKTNDIDIRWSYDRMQPTETICDLCGEVILESERRFDTEAGVICECCRNNHNVEMERVKSPFAVQYVGKGYKSQFICPVCGRKVWQHLNYLGNKRLHCKAGKIIKV